MDNEMNPPGSAADVQTDTAPAGKSVRKGLAIGLTAGLLGGAAAGFAFGVPGLSGAASPSVVQQTEDTVPSTDPATTDAETSTVPVPDVEAGTRLREALQPLAGDHGATGPLDDGPGG